MPIARELRHFYGREWRLVTRPRILERAGDRCEQCGAPDRQFVLRGPLGTWFDTFPMRPSFWRTHLGWKVHVLELDRMRVDSIRRVYIVLAVAHLNHIPGDDRDENLKALCQWCHLNYDCQAHRATRATRKDNSRPLLAGTPPLLIA